MTTRTRFRRIVFAAVVTAAVIGIGAPPALAAAAPAHGAATAARAAPRPFPKLSAGTGKARSAAVSAAICTYPTGALCMDRAGEGHSNGTKIIGWPPNLNDNAEDLHAALLNTWCNGGFVTQTCPFTVGSGLNARYATACGGAACPILYIYSEYFSSECIGADSSWSFAILNGCVPNGGAFVGSTTNGTFLIDVGVSNHWYGILHTYNQPYWLVSDGTRGDQLDIVPQASNSWGCVGSGSCF
jgi:hypothetical protein